MDVILLALDVIEKEAKRLKVKREKKEKIGFDDVKDLLKALGQLAEDPEILTEASKRSIWYGTGLRMFSGAMKKL